MYFVPFLTTPRVLTGLNTINERTLVLFSFQHFAQRLYFSTITGDVSTAITGASRAPVHGVHLGGERGAPSAVHSVHHK